MSDDGAGTIIIVDGKKLAVQQPAVSISNRAYNYGDGLFETLRVEDGRCPLWTLHQQRMLSGCERLGLQVDIGVIHKSVLEICAEGQSGILKIIIHRRSGGRASYPSASLEAGFSCEFHSCVWEGQWLQNPVVLKRGRTPLSSIPLLAGLKHLNRLEYILLAREVPLAANEELLLLDTDGCAVETMHHNLFCLLGDTLVTPCLENAGVKGVMRRLILDFVATDLELVVEERPLADAELRRATEIFICNAVRGIVPVTGVAEVVSFHSDRIARDVAAGIERFIDSGLDRL